ncbi:MAG: NAD(P)/FAD-dependent oxidoreductase [Pseudomonadota bacterium]
MQPSLAVQDQSQSKLHRIVIVGGGAGGLELATQLGNKEHKEGRADIVLVDRSATHIWKPLLHEVAAGTMDEDTHELEYVAQARWHHFEFQQGELIGLDRARHVITISAVFDEDGMEILPRREITYDTLVLAIGSEANFFDIPGAKEHAIAIDTAAEAEHFRRRWLAICIRANSDLSQKKSTAAARIDIVIIGGGATGVELAAELRSAAEVLNAYGLRHLNPRRDIRITIVEAGPRILAGVQERVADNTVKLLCDLDVEILVNERVTRVDKNAVFTASGKKLLADLTVWTAGIRVSKVLADIGLPSNKLGQVPVLQTLQTEVDQDIFAFGDCASCPWPEKGTVTPPRAQVAQQQAKFLYHALRKRLAKKPLPLFEFHDHGSLISLGRFDAVGNLMGKLIGKALLIEGTLARVLYVWLYRRHLMALHGFLRMLANWMAQWLRRRTSPRVKLH